MVLEKVAAIERRYEELNALMADQTAATDPARLSDLVSDRAAGWSATRRRTPEERPRE